MPKPPVFGHGSREAEISAWRGWSWTFEQYMSSVDPKFADDIQSVRADLDRSVDPVDSSGAEKQRNTFFYSMLASLLTKGAVGGTSGDWVQWVGGLSNSDPSE